MVTCPNCNKTMLEKSFRYKHINECGKAKVPKAKPIEQLIEEKKIVQEVPVAKAKAKPKAKTQQSAKKVALPPAELPPAIEQPVKNEFWERRKLHTNLLNERKLAMVKKIMVKAF